MGMRAGLWLAAAIAGHASAAVDHYGVEHGMSQNSVVAIAEDARGFLWLGTEDGLNRFDGHSFKVFRSEPLRPGLSDSFIQRLARDGETLWIGTVGGGLSRMDLRTERISGLRDVAPDSPAATQTIFSIYPHGTDQVLVGTNSGLWNVRWDGQIAPDIKAIELPIANAVVRAITELASGSLAIGGDNVLCVLDASLRNCEPLRTEGSDVESRNVLALAATDDGFLWASIEDEGLLRITPNLDSARWWRFRSDLPPGMARIPALATLNGSDLWIGSDVGAWRYRRSCDCIRERVDRHVPGLQGRKIVYGLAPTDGGAVWIGHWNHGLERFDPRRAGIVGFRPQLEANPPTAAGNVRAFAFDGNTVWLASYGAGLVEGQPDGEGGFRFRQPDWIAPRSVRQSLVWALARDADERLWLGSDGGLQRVDPRSQTSTDIRDADGRLFRSVRTLLIDDKGLLWVGSEVGLTRLDPAHPELVAYEIRSPDGKPLPDRRIFALHQDKAGQYWMGTWSGVYRFDAEHLQLGEVLAPEAGLRVVWDIEDADDGGLWIGTSDGLVHVPKNGQWRRFTEDHGLANRVVYGIERDDAGFLWLSSNRGLMRFSTATGAVVNFGLNDGLVQNEFLFGSHARGPDGNLWFGGIHGFQRIRPSEVARADGEPRPVVTEVRVDGESLLGTDRRMRVAAPALERLSLDPGSRVLEIHYSAIAFDQPSDVRFEYRLDGYDQSWQQAGSRRFALYTGLPPGNYRFDVKAKSRFGLPSKSARSFMVEVEPRWWQRPWIQWGGLATLLAIAGGLVRWRLGDLRMQREALEHTVALRTRELGMQRDELRRVNSELDALSRLDPLTGLANRRELLDRLSLDLDAAARSDKPVSVVLWDIDHFKHVNDTYGHATGDAVLVGTTRLWRRQIPEGGLLGRHGGEEFLLLLPGHTSAQALELASDLLHALQEAVVCPALPSLRVTASAGVAQWQGEGESLERLLQRADQSLYQAKHEGRSRCLASA